MIKEMTSKQAVERMREIEEVLEKLSDLEHKQWWEWSYEVCPEVKLNRLERWQKYWIDYSELLDEVKEHDRVWARKVLECIGLKQEAKEIYELFKDGCELSFMCEGRRSWNTCGCNIWLCPNCQEIKETWKRINSQRKKDEEGTQDRPNLETRNTAEEDNNLERKTVCVDNHADLLSSITRIEVIENGERKYNKWDCKVKHSIQDKGRTLKLFVSDS